MSKLTRPQWISLVILVGVNLIIRMVWIFHYHPVPQSDFGWYYQHAISISQGHGYSTNGQPTAYWPIGYPFFLSLIFDFTGPSVMAGLTAQVLLSAGIVAIIFLLALRTTKSTMVGIVAAIAYTVLPTSITTNSDLGSEELFTFLLVLGLYMYVIVDSGRTWLRLILTGIVLGAACVVRPLAALFPIFMVAYEWWIVRRSFKRSLGRVVVVLVMMVLAISPVTIRNEVAMHHLIPISTNGGVNLWQGTMSNGYYWSTNPKINPLLRTSNEIVRNQIGEKAFETYVIHHPTAVIRNGFVKIFNLYRNDRGSDVQLPYGPIYTLMMTVDYAMYHVWIWLALLGIIPLVRRYDWRKTSFILVFIGYYTAVFFFFPAWSRFRFPIMPLLSIPLGALLVWLGSMVSRLTRRTEQSQ
ncbi:glycosyltransferase family 39 protein [Alicyclobacillus sp. ALC3]|uniref:glycosyltransferase family 39 protein n=1 Tax=Alicyclobacillus sp. ALC3 TaxID=2796143 RepID=UPI00237929F8|nr:glycosyltransferase family 39 protein [Alicyclobacillus sp. ALC3]WDL95232.1 glycosyltransferase family 39 protein [Alicyclobacillus sp. ALC3]